MLGWAGHISGWECSAFPLYNLLAHHCPYTLNHLFIPILPSSLVKALDVFQLTQKLPDSLELIAVMLDTSYVPPQISSACLPPRPIDSFYVSAATTANLWHLGPWDSTMWSWQMSCPRLLNLSLAVTMKPCPLVTCQVYDSLDYVQIWMSWHVIIRISLSKYLPKGWMAWPN